MSELSLPPISVVDVYYTLIHLKQTGTRDLEGLHSKILKLLAPIIADTLTYVYNLCIHKSCFPKVFKAAQIIPIYKHVPKLTLLTIGRYQFFPYCLNLLKNTYTSTC